MTTIKVEYIGIKALKEDNVSDSGVTWEGPGDIQEVTPAQWGKLAKHPGVWRRVVDKPEASVPLSIGSEAEKTQVAQAVPNLAQAVANLPQVAIGVTQLTYEQVAAAKFNFPLQTDGNTKETDKDSQPGAAKGGASTPRARGASRGVK